MNADTADCGLLAKRGLSTGLHAIVCAASPQSTCPRNMRIQGSFESRFCQNAGETLCALDGADPPAMSGKSPLLANNLTLAGFRANSRFLTDCYL